MDDPWGSPWAEESPYLSQKVDKLVSNKSVSSERDLGASQDTTSPWNDDDGYGEWATLPTTDEIQVTLQNGPEQAESVGSDASVSEVLTQGKDHIRPDGSNWFAREMPPVNVRNLIVDNSQMNKRALSPDPWAQEVSISDEKTRPESRENANSGFQSTSDPHKDVPRVETLAVSDLDKPERADHGELDGLSPLEGIRDMQVENPLSKQDEKVTTVALDHGGITTTIGEATQAECSASRPSSSPSDHSHHEEVFAESPRTSFEDAEERPKLEREGSSKVKEMVRLFDGLAVDQSPSDLSSQVCGETREDELNTPRLDQPEDDFGDFEEGTLDTATKNVQLEELTVIPEAKQAAKAGAQDELGLDVSPEQEIMNPSDHRTKTYGPINFEPEISLIGQLFDSTVNSDSVHADPTLAPEIEAVITDSLSSIQERKTWYRVSRYGTLRKHNAGDEDNYIRINWKDSQIRVETLKTVERWIEEDRHGGGVILGGGTRFGSMFGWGQKNAAPMSVAAALASRSGKTAVHPDQVETTMQVVSPDGNPIPTSASDMRPLGQISAPGKSFQSPLSATAPQFTWSTGTPISSNGETKPPTLTGPSNSPNVDQKLGSTNASRNIGSDPSLRVPILMSAAPSTHKSALAQSPITVSHESTNVNIREYSVNSVSLQVEDEWGEMVSSPPLESPLVLPVTAQVDAVTSGIPSPVSAPNSSAIGLGTQSNTPSALDVLATLPPAGNPVSLNVESPTIKPDSAQSVVPKSDAWQAADFSFFDEPVRSTPMPAPVPMDLKALSHSPNTFKQGNGPQSEQMEQDKVVKSIVQNLPNLSYMFRR